VIPTGKVLSILGALLAPLNNVEQSTIDKDGNMVPTQHLTHKQSKDFNVSNTTVNGRVIKEAFQDYKHGHCVLRMLH